MKNSEKQIQKLKQANQILKLELDEFIEAWFDAYESHQGARCIIEEQLDQITSLTRKNQALSLIVAGIGWARGLLRKLPNPSESSTLN